MEVLLYVVIAVVVVIAAVLAYAAARPGRFGPSPFMSKLMGVFINIDRMVGKDFEAGLVNLKAKAEGRA